VRFCTIWIGGSFNHLQGEARLHSVPEVNLSLQENVMTKMSSLMIFVLPKDSDGEQMFY
jgi:hypothetical protein